MTNARHLETSKPQQKEEGEKERKRGSIVVVFCRRKFSKFKQNWRDVSVKTWILLSDFQKMSKVFNKKQELKEVRKTKPFVSICKKTKVVNQSSSPFLNTFACSAVSCCTSALLVATNFVATSYEIVH
jgi:hypothetical protein